MNRNLLESWGSHSPRPAVAAVDAASWVQAAGGRPEWILWGKAQPEGDVVAHPLLCHCLDVAAVAALFLTDRLPRSLRARLLGVHPDPEQALRWLLFLVALHDLGKATPAFQMKVPWALPALTTAGFQFRLTAREGRHHSETGMYLLTSVLEDRGAAEELAADLARSVTAHHGLFPTDDCFDPSQLHPKQWGDTDRWGEARQRLVDALGDFFQVPEPTRIEPLTRGDLMTLAGLTSVADSRGLSSRGRLRASSACATRTASRARAAFWASSRPRSAWPPWSWGS